jgi:CheY-like chemotaxis protein
MPKNILLVEDSEDDAFFIIRAFKNAGMLAPVSHVEDGNQAVEYISGRGLYADRAQFPMPPLILLDIKMPFMSGFEVLRWIREQSSFPNVPVVMCTSSNQDCDIEKAYALGANAYLMKPNHGEDYSDLASLIKRFWLEANLPPQPKPENARTAGATSSLPSETHVLNKSNVPGMTKDNDGRPPNDSSERVLLLPVVIKSILVLGKLVAGMTRFWPTP